MRQIAVSRWSSRTPIARLRACSTARGSAALAPERVRALSREQLRGRQTMRKWTWMRRDSECPRDHSLKNLLLTPPCSSLYCLELRVLRGTYSYVYYVYSQLGRGSVAKPLSNYESHVASFSTSALLICIEQ